MSIEIRSGVRYESRSQTTTAGSESITTLDGQPFEVTGDRIRIGPKTYGPVKVGDKVVIDADGVRINGDLAEPLP